MISTTSTNIRVVCSCLARIPLCGLDRNLTLSAFQKWSRDPSEALKTNSWKFSEIANGKLEYEIVFDALLSLQRTKLNVRGIRSKADDRPSSEP